MLINKRAATTKMRKQELLQYINCLESRVSKETGGINHEPRFQQAFKYSPAVWLIVDPDTGSIVEANAAASNFYGYSIEQLKRMTVFDINLSPMIKIQQCMASAKRTITQPIAFQHKLKSGVVKDVHVYSSPFCLCTRTLLSSIIIDVTESKKAKKELKENRDRLAIVVEATQAGIWDWNTGRKKLFLDSRCKAIFGYSEHELADWIQVWQNLFHPEDIWHIRQAARNSLLGKSDHFDIECRIRHKDGCYRWIHATGKISDYHQPISLIGSIHDITDKKRIEKVRHEYGQKLKDFLQVVSDISLIIDEDGRQVEIFGNDEDLLSISKQGTENFGLFNGMQKDQAEKFLEEIKLVIINQETRSFKQTIILPKGKRTMITRMALLNDTVEGKKTVAVSMVDVTDREKALDMLQAAYEMRRRSDILNDLINGIRQLNEETLTFLKSLGISLVHPLLCCVIHLGVADSASSKQQYYFNGQQSPKDEIINELNSIQGCTAWACRGKVGVLCQSSQGILNSKTSCKQLVRSLQGKIQELYPWMPLTIGVGEIQKGFKGFGKSFQQAWEAIAAAHCTATSKEGIICFNDLGVYQLLVEQSGQERAHEFIETTIGKLIRYDYDKGTSYLSTLEVILQCSNLKEAAQLLFLHHNTVVFRKRRIEEILDRSIHEFDTKVMLAMAIKLYKLNS